MSKKAQAGNQMMIIPFLLLLLMVGGGIVMGVYLFFGEDYDVRGVDSDLLNYKVKKCILENDVGFDSIESLDNFHKVCKLDKIVINDTLLLMIYLDDGPDAVYELGPGDKTLCDLADKNQNFPRCTTTEFLKNIDGEFVKYTIIAGSGQRSRILSSDDESSGIEIGFGQEGQG